ncbi:efflux RND transporter periplasmic adaptor subunit [Aquabacterium sp.]|uniref:efflux RND transporter periplasmic adaptor subunit n=1 Tax=Aquabacterium sp. TaxID=1872578 RepID=UPI003783ABF2
MRQFALPLLAVALLAACSKTPPAEEPVRSVRTLTVAGATVNGQHEYAAEIRARTESRLAFRVGGKLVRRLVDSGQAVKAGQPLAQIDPQDLQLGQQAAQAALASAQVNLEVSEAEFKRYKELRDQGFISGMELDRREATLKAARAQVAQARAQAGVQGNQASYAVLTADAAGVITGVDAEPGAVVSAGTPVLRLAHDGPRDAVFSVPEDRVAAVRALLGRKDALHMRLWGDDKVLPATVREVAAAADPVTRTFQVKADVGSAAVRLGQTAAVLVDAPAMANVVRLPLAAVFELQGKSQVWLLDRSTMTVQPRAIQVAGADGNEVVVGGGLQAGQVVVAAGVHALTPGQKVRQYVEPGSAAAAMAASVALPGAASTARADGR